MYSLWETAQLGPMTLKNRTVRSATNEHLSELDGSLTSAWVDAMSALARGGVGLIISGHMTVDGTQRADEGQPVLDARADLALLKQAADAAHAQNAALLIQLSHSGLKAPVHVNGCPVKGPNDFTLEELDTLVEQFTYAARRCQQAGLDGVQIHNAHAYLLSSFLNPNENTRTDEYGGSLENRFRIIERIVRSVRAACGPDFALLVKTDCNVSGDLHGLLQLYQKAGVDGVEISGIGFSARAGEREPFFLNELLQARDGIDLPLILVGGIFSKATAESVLAAGVPFVSFSRALICQSDFIHRMESGQQTESSCLACNGCYRVYRQRPVLCVQHTEPIPHLSKLFGC